VCRACAARACAFANSVYNRRSSAANFTLMMGMVMLSIWHVWLELSTTRQEPVMRFRLPSLVQALST
jgi:hypothetical protein